MVPLSGQSQGSIEEISVSLFYLYVVDPRLHEFHRTLSACPGSNELERRGDRGRSLGGDDRLAYLNPGICRSRATPVVVVACVCIRAGTNQSSEASASKIARIISTSLTVKSISFLEYQGRLSCKASLAGAGESLICAEGLADDDSQFRAYTGHDGRRNRN
jgi:hypothetical protein